MTTGGASERASRDWDPLVDRPPTAATRSGSRPTGVEITPAQGEALRVEIRLRESATYGVQRQIEDIISRLRRLEQRGTVETVDISVWGRDVTTADPGSTERYRTYRAFKEWATQNGCDLAPAFQRRVTNQTLLDDEPRTVRIVVPIVCIALYDEDGIKAVFPHCVAGEAMTVDRALELLETGVSPAALLDDEQ